MRFPGDLVLTFLRDGRTVRVSAERLILGERVLDGQALAEGGAALVRALTQGLASFTPTRILLVFEISDFVPVPWESLLGRFEPWSGVPVLRSMHLPPAVAAQPLQLPVRVLQLERLPLGAVNVPDLLADVFRSQRTGMPHGEMEKVFETRRVLLESWNEIPAWLTGDRIDLLQLEGIPHDLAATGELRSALIEARARLLVLNIDESERGAGFLLAREIAGQGGPPVLVTWLDHLVARDFYATFYEQIVHDWSVQDARLEAEKAIGQTGVSSLTTGPDGENLLLLSPLLRRAYRRRDEAQARLQQVRAAEQRIQGTWTEGILDSLRGGVLAGKGSLDGAAAWELIQGQWPIHWESESQSSIPIARNLQLIDQVLASIGAREEELEARSRRAEVSFLRQRGKPPEPQPRHVNTWLLDRQGRVPTSRPLRVETLYRLHVDIGSLAEESSVTNPVAIPAEALESLFRRGGDWVQVAVYGHQFDLCPGQESALQQLWLPTIDPSQPLEFSAIPLKAGAAYLRICVYYRNQLLQSLRLDARVLPESGDAAVLDGFPEGYATRIEYTVTPDFRKLADLPPRAVTLFTNKRDDTHMIGIKVGAWDEAGQHLDDWTDAVSLPSGALVTWLDEIRKELDAIGTGKIADREIYSFTNGGSPEKLKKSLGRLACLGRSLFNDLFPEDKIQDQLAVALASPGQTIHVARLLADSDVLPWGVLYDLPLDPAVEPEVCLEPLQHVDDQGRLAFRPCGGGSCLLNDHVRDNVVCPWGFWGIKHILEQPAQRVDDELAPRKLITEIPIKARPRISMSLSTRLERFEEHRKTLEGWSGIDFTCAGDDRTVSGQPSPEPGREQVLKELATPDLHVIYFYCHGGKTRIGVERPCLSVGSSETPYLLPDSLIAKKYQWTEHPLVFLNACRSVELDPRLLGGFVSTFVLRGAAGVIGTEVRVWEPLATEFAEQFLEKFLRGERVGAILRDLRHGLLLDHNPLGLVYTNYCSADLHLVLPVSRA